MMHGQPNIKIK